MPAATAHVPRDQEEPRGCPEPLGQLDGAAGEADRIDEPEISMRGDEELHQPTPLINSVDAMRLDQRNRKKRIARGRRSRVRIGKEEKVLGVRRAGLGPLGLAVVQQDRIPDATARRCVKVAYEVLVCVPSVLCSHQQAQVGH